MADRGDHLAQVVRHGDVDVRAVAAVVDEPARLAVHDRQLGRHVERVVGADLRPEAILERRDQASSAGVVLGVRRGDEHHVEGQANLVAAHLHVAFLEGVEQADLDPLGEIGKLVDGEDPPVGARDEAVVQRQLVGEVAPLGDADRVDLADQVGDRGVRCRQLLAVALVAVHPADRRVVTQLGDEVAGITRHGSERIVVDLAPGDDRQPLVEQVWSGSG